MQCIMQHQGTEALVQPGKSFLRNNGRVAVKSAVVARDDWQNLETSVSVVDDRTGSLTT